jgi:outer membrane usher protein
MQKSTWSALNAAVRMAMAGCGVALAVAASARLHAETAASAASGAFAVPVSTKISDRLVPEPSPAPAATAGTDANATMPPSTATAVQSPTAAPPAPAPVAASPATPALADDTALGEIEWAKPPAGASASDGRLNPTDRTIELTLPLRDGQFYLGDVNARVSPQDEISLAKERLVQMMTPLLRTASLESLNTIADADGYLPLTAIKEKGFEAGFDPAKIELQISPTIEQRATGQLSAGRGRGQVISENLTAPAIFAGYVNIRAGADYSTESFYGDDGTVGTRTGFDGALRWLDVVFESSAIFDAEDGFSRGSSRFVHDRPDLALRFSAGDIVPLKTGYQGGSDLLGLSVEKSYAKLQPSTNINPTGSRSFRIERPSNVDVMINGFVIQRLHLRPGDYDLKDLPLAAGANDITLVIEDDVGQKRTLEFSVFSGRSLLAPGLSEWALSAGVASRFDSDRDPDFSTLFSNVDYDTESPVVTGFYARGLTADLTGSVHLQADTNSVMGGAGAAVQTSFGFWAFDAAASQSFDHGLGYAANLGYDLTNIEGSDGIIRSVRLAADYRSENFSPLSAIDDPRNDIMLALAAMYTQDLPWDLSGSVSGIYSLGRGDEGDRYGVDIALSRNFGPSLSAGLSLGYELSTGYDDEDDEFDGPDGFKAAIRIGYRLTENSSLDGGYDAGDGRSQLTYRHREGDGVGGWNAQVELGRTPSGSDDEPDDFGVNGALVYVANRAEVGFSQHTGLAGLDTGEIDQRTSLTAGTAIAFADGRFAVGRPISNGFAIIGTHSNLPDSEVAIGASEEESQAASDFLGPALLSDISPYSPKRVPYDVSNLPVGYDLGAGAFDLYPGYRSGYRLTVGSDYTITAFGTLADADGEPIALLTGTAYEDGGADDHKVTIFTNRTGRFGAQGLRPGRWIIDMATDPPIRFRIEIPKDTVGLLKLDTLKPTETVQ